MPWIFEYLYRMGKPLLSEAAYNSAVMYKKSPDVFKELHSKHFDKVNLPAEFGGDYGVIDNSEFIKKVLELEDYFKQIQSSIKGKK